MIERPPPRRTPSPGRDLVAYAEASGDPNPIHQDPEVARSVGLPDVIAHGMFTLALVARYVDEQLGEPGPDRRARRQVHQAGRRARGRHDGRDRGHLARRAHPRPARHLRRGDRSRQPGGGPACLSPSSGSPTTPRCGSAGPRGPGSARRPRTRSSKPSRDADQAGEPVLVLAGGSNVVVADEGFAGTVVEVATTGVHRPTTRSADPTCGGVLVTVAAGESWDALVARAVDSGWVGVEALSGIPGSVGATPIQNVGAYGQEVSQTLASVRVWDRRLRGVRTFAAADCGFGYRTSRFKADPGTPRRPRARPSSSGRATWPPRWPTPSSRAPSGVAPGARAADDRRTPRPCSTCAGARGWSSTPTTTTPGAPAPSSPTPSSRAEDLPAGAPVLAAARRPLEDQRRLADRARRLRQGVRRRCRPALRQAHPGPDQPWVRHHDRAARPRPRDPRRGRVAGSRSGSFPSPCSSAASS